MSEYNRDCCFTSGQNWFRYRVGAVIISEEYALFAANDRDDYYYTVGGGVHMGEYSRDAVLRETMEETGLELEIERPLCIIENFFDGDGSLDGFEFYFARSPHFSGRSGSFLSIDSIRLAVPFGMLRPPSHASTVFTETPIT